MAIERLAANHTWQAVSATPQDAAALDSVVWVQSDDYVLILLPCVYLVIFVICVFFPERHVFLEWLRREHIRELLQHATAYKEDPNDDGFHNECVLCLDTFENGSQVRHQHCAQ